MPRTMIGASSRYLGLRAARVPPAFTGGGHRNLEAHASASAASPEGGEVCYPGFISPLSQLYLAVISALSRRYLSLISALSQPYLSLISALSHGYLTVISALAYLSFTSALSQSCLGLISTALKQGLAIAKGIFAFERRSLPTCDSKSNIRNLNTERQARIWV